MAKKIYYSWDDVERFCRELARRTSGRTFDGVYGPARGGLPIAVMMSHLLHLPLLMSPTNKTLLVDDICDTGDTLYRYRMDATRPDLQRPYIATMAFVKGGPVEPDYHMFEKHEGDWVVFPWELESKNE